MNKSLTERTSISYIGEVVVIHQQFAQRLHRRFLQHIFQFCRIASRGHEHAVILSYLWTKPQAIAHHVGIGYGLKRFGATYIHIATHHHRMQVVRCLSHNLLIEWHLQRQQVLRQSLSPLPSEHRYGCQYLSRRCVGWQSSALTAGMQEYPLLTAKPLVEGNTSFFTPHSSFLTPRFVRLLEQPCRSASRPKLTVYRVISTKPLLAWVASDIMETSHQVWRKR